VRGASCSSALPDNARSLATTWRPAPWEERAVRAGRTGIPRLSALHTLRAQLLRTAHPTRSLGELIDELSGETGSDSWSRWSCTRARIPAGWSRPLPPAMGAADRAPAPAAFRSPGPARGRELSGLADQFVAAARASSRARPKGEVDRVPGSRLDLPGRPPALGDELAAAIRSAAADVKGSPTRGPSGHGGHSRGLPRRSEDGRRDETGTHRLLARRGRGS